MTPLRRQLHGTTSIVRDPISIGAAILGSVGTVPIIFNLTAQAIVGNLVLMVVSSFIQAALAPKINPGDFNSGGILTNVRDAASPRRVIYGETRVGGPVTYIEATGDANKFLHMIVCLAGHEVQEIGTIYINDLPVVLDANGFVNDPPWNGKVRVKKHLGIPGQAVDPDLDAESAIIDANFRGEGVAYIYVRLEYDQDVFAGGIPTFTAVVKGRKVFDPRNGTTAFSGNAALCVRDYITSDIGLSDTEVDDVYFAAAANVCDENVALFGGGTQRRYEINGSFTLDQTPGVVLDQMMTACAGMLFFGGGQWKLKPGYYTAPVKTFTLDDLRGPISLNTRVPRRDNFNVVRGTFNDLEQDWITADFPQIRGPAFIAEDAGIESALDLALPFTTASGTAQRIAKLALFRGREQMAFEADFSLAAMDVEVGDILGLTFDRYGWTAKEFEVVGWRLITNSNEGDVRVRLSLRETSAAAYSWNAEERDIIGNNSNLPDFTAGLDIFNLTASGGGSLQGDGKFVSSAILNWSPVNNAFVDRYEVQWKPVPDSNWAATYTSAPPIELAPLIDGVEYIFRVRAVTTLNNRGPFATVTMIAGGDTVPPAVPTNITATGNFKYITVEWTNAPDADLNYVEVWENTSNSTVGAVQVGRSAGDNFVRPNLGLDETRWYFLRSVDYSGNVSAFSAGVSATTTWLDDPDFENGIYSLFTDQGLFAIRDVTVLPPAGTMVGDKVFNRTDGKLYEWDGTAWNPVVADVGPIDFSQITGQVQDAQIAAVDATKIAGQITGTQIADNSISTPKLIAGSITTAKIATGAIQANNIAAGAVIAGKIAANAVTANELAANSVTAAKILAGTITGDRIQANTITGGLLATSGVITNSAQINNGVIENANIGNAEISTLKIQGQAVTVPVTMQWSGVWPASSGTFSRTMSVTMGSAGVLFAHVMGVQGYTGTVPPAWQFVLDINGVEVYNTGTVGGAFQQSIGASGALSVGAGTHSVRARWLGSGGTIQTIGQLSFYAVGVQR